MNTTWIGLLGSLLVLYATSALRYWAQRKRYPDGTRPPWVTRARSLANTEVIAFAGFAAAMAFAQNAGATSYRTGVVALAFLVTRIAYGPAYVFDLAYLRTLLGVVSLLLTGTLLTLAS
ncbi:MAG: hypothetical protein B7733_02915 [Myxococcales bacterium FL481]|nr:MAG: hypothetical protein B7733_02915 [Myxococcales bacterium FL481]